MKDHLMFLFHVGLSAMICGGVKTMFGSSLLPFVL